MRAHRRTSACTTVGHGGLQSEARQGAIAVRHRRSGCNRRGPVAALRTAVAAVSRPANLSEVWLALAQTDRPPLRAVRTFLSWHDQGPGHQPSVWRPNAASAGPRARWTRSGGGRHPDWPDQSS